MTFTPDLRPAATISCGAGHPNDNVGYPSTMFRDWREPAKAEQWLADQSLRGPRIIYRDPAGRTAPYSFHQWHTMESWRQDLVHYSNVTELYIGWHMGPDPWRIGENTARDYVPSLDGQAFKDFLATAANFVACGVTKIWCDASVGSIPQFTALADWCSKNLGVQLGMEAYVRHHSGHPHTGFALAFPQRATWRYHRQRDPSHQWRAPEGSEMLVDFTSHQTPAEKRDGHVPELTAEIVAGFKSRGFVPATDRVEWDSLCQEVAG